MACIWQLTANFHKDEKAARAFRANYNASVFDVPHAGRIIPLLSLADGSTGWECHVTPCLESSKSHDYLDGHAGPANHREAEDLDVAAKVLYDRLSRSEGYSFALYGCEVGGWRDCKELIEDLSPGGFLRAFMKERSDNAAGLVIHEWLWKEAEQPEGFTRFSPLHLWTPWTRAWEQR